MTTNEPIMTNPTVIQTRSTTATQVLVTSAAVVVAYGFGKMVGAAKERIRQAKKDNDL